MRLHIGAIPESDFHPDETWRPLREPSPFTMQVFSIPLAVVLGFGVVQAWQWIGLPPAKFTEVTSIFMLAFVVLSFPAIIIVHELLHASAFPKDGAREDVLIGVWSSRMLFYAHYHGEMSRNRFLLVFVAPFVVISLLPLAVASVVPLPGWLLLALAWCSTWNAIFACGDAFGVALILSQIPGNARVRNLGYRTYWRLAPTTAPG